MVLKHIILYEDFDVSGPPADASGNYSTGSNTLGAGPIGMFDIGLPYKTVQGLEKKTSPKKKKRKKKQNKDKNV